MPKLSDYVFGSVVVDGETVTSDLIILPEGTVKTDWWRQTGHRLVPEDLLGLLDTQPDLFVIGTGASGMMIVSEDILDDCRRLGIEVAEAPTDEAVREYNRAVKRGVRVLACFHLTC